MSRWGWVCPDKGGYVQGWVFPDGGGYVQMGWVCLDLGGYVQMGVGTQSSPCY